MIAIEPEPEPEPADKSEQKHETEKTKKEKELEEASKRNRLPTFEEWSTMDCTICSEPIRSLYDGSPLDINEHMDIGIMYSHADIISMLLALNVGQKKEPACPLCRKAINVQEMAIRTLPRLRCRAVIKRCRKKENADRVGRQCECLEEVGNMGFCRKHLPVIAVYFLL